MYCKYVKYISVDELSVQKVLFLDKNDVKHRCLQCHLGQLMFIMRLLIKRLMNALRLPAIFCLIFTFKTQYVIDLLSFRIYRFLGKPEKSTTSTVLCSQFCLLSKSNISQDDH